MIGETVGSYRIVAKLSIGGMGTVYKAKHTIIGKLAAVKVLHPELCTNPDIVNRFLKEAQATTTIKHPGIVDVIDFGYMKSGHAFLVMEFLEGMSLARRIKRRGRMSEGEAAMLLRAVCVALAAAHDKGIVHRDLKPDNIFLVPDPESAVGERPKLLDFGIAKLTDVGLAGSATKTGAVMGTPTYMSPEQCRGTGDVDHRADLYSIGCIYYELVTGRPPFTNLGAGELIGTHIYVEPEPPSVHEPTLSPETEALIMALLQKRPERRPQTSRELAQRLTALAERQAWITSGSPSGVTAAVLPDLAEVPPGPPGPAELAARTELELTEPPLGATAPYGLTPAPAPAGDGVEAPVDKPTTLSGAASQSVANPPRRPRRGVALAMLGAALVSGGIVAIVQLSGSEPEAPAAQGTAPAARPAAPAPVTPAPAPVAPAPAPPAPAPAPAAAVAPVAPDPSEAPEAAPKPAAPAPIPRAVKPRPAPRATAKPPKPPAKPEPPAKPKPPDPPDPDQLDPRKLIETELD